MTPLKHLLYTNIDQTFVNSLHKLLSSEIGGLGWSCYYTRV